MGKIIDIMFNLKKHNGLDYNVAERIEKIFEEGNFSNVESYEIEKVSSPEYSAKLCYMSFTEWSQKAVKANLVDAEETIRLEKELANSIENNKETLGAMFKLVIARK